MTQKQMPQRNNRGQTAITITRFFLAIGVGAVLFWIVQLVATPILNRSMNATSNATANQATRWFQTATLDYIPIIMIFISLFGMIAYAVFVRGANR